MTSKVAWASSVPEMKEEGGDSWQRAPARIKVVGVGGGGCNTVRRMMSRTVRGVKYVMINTDIKALEMADPNARDMELVQIGRRVTHGWGAGGIPKAGEDAAEESADDIRHALREAELVFVTAGMGGGTGTGATPYVAHLAKEMGALVVGVVTTPFGFEGRRRSGEAIAGIRRLRPYMDNLVVIHNDRLLECVNHDVEMLNAFKTADEVVTQGILSVSELINVPGEINVDFADVKTIMAHPGGALMALGNGHGNLGPVEAAKHAIRNPLLNLSIKDAKGVLFSVRGGHEVTLGGCNAAGQLIRNAVSPKAQIFFGMTVDYGLNGTIQLTLIATGLKEDSWWSALTDLGGLKLVPPLLNHSAKGEFTPIKK